MYSPERTVNPTVEPIDLEDAKCQIGIEHHDDDTLINRRIRAVRDWLEKLLWSSFCTQTWVLKADCFPTRFTLPWGPLQSVSSITYVDTGGATQTLASDQYTVITNSRKPGLIVPAYGVDWPATRDVEQAVTVTYVAGYGDAATDVPEPIREAMLVAVDHLYCHGDLGNVLDAVWPMLVNYKMVSAEALEFV